VHGAFQGSCSHDDHYSSTRVPVGSTEDAGPVLHRLGLAERLGATESIINASTIDRYGLFTFLVCRHHRRPPGPPRVHVVQTLHSVESPENNCLPLLCPGADEVSSPPSPHGESGNLGQRPARTHCCAPPRSNTHCADTPVAVLTRHRVVPKSRRRQYAFLTARTRGCRRRATTRRYVQPPCVHCHLPRFGCTQYVLAAGRTTSFSAQ
jgi:hypothetical protein